GVLLRADREAAMLRELARMLRDAMRREIRGRSRDDERRRRETLRRERRICELLRDADHDVVATGDDVDARLGHMRVENDVGIASAKLVLQARQQHGAATRRDAEPQPPYRPLPQALDG